MEWISVKDKLPKPDEPVWIYWKDRDVLIGWRTYHGLEAFLCPPSEGWYSWEDEKCRWVNWWMPIDNKPLPPKEK